MEGFPLLNLWGNCYLPLCGAEKITYESYDLGLGIPKKKGSLAPSKKHRKTELKPEPDPWWDKEEHLQTTNCWGSMLSFEGVPAEK